MVRLRVRVKVRVTHGGKAGMAGQPALFDHAAAPEEEERQAWVGVLGSERGGHSVHLECIRALDVAAQPGALAVAWQVHRDHDEAGGAQRLRSEARRREVGVTAQPVVRDH